MYFDKKITELFAQNEKNEKNFRVASILDRVAMCEISILQDPILVAELGGGAHPDRYDRLFARILKKPQGKIDWVDVSPYMLEMAKKYVDIGKYKKRKSVIRFVESDLIQYLRDAPDVSIDLVLMKYTIDHIQDIETLFVLLLKKLKPNGRLVATIGVLSPELKSISTNARFLYQGKEFPENETRTLSDGESFGVQFLKKSGDLSAGYLEGAKTEKYYHSSETMIRLGTKYGFEVVLGDWKKVVEENARDSENMDQDVLILRKMSKP